MSINIAQRSHIVLGRPASLGVPPGAQKKAHGISLDSFDSSFFIQRNSRKSNRPTHRSIMVGVSPP